jgi:hypothetical protein
MMIIGWAVLLSCSAAAVTAAAAAAAADGAVRKTGGGEFCGSAPANGGLSGLFFDS